MKPKSEAQKIEETKLVIPDPPWTRDALEEREPGLYERLAREYGCGTFSASFQPALDLTEAWRNQQSEEGSK